MMSRPCARCHQIRPFSGIWAPCWCPACHALIREELAARLAAARQEVPEERLAEVQPGPWYWPAECLAERVRHGDNDEPNPSQENAIRALEGE